MIKKYLSYVGIMIFACFSFYYTDQAVDIVRRNDPIMKSIINNKDKYTVLSVSADIDYDEIIPGINGKEVDINKSYKNMKKTNKYSEDMLIFKDIVPDISYINEYDKYIVSGNKNKNEIALVFKINSIEYIDIIDEILLNKEITATFFIDGTIINDNIDLIKILNKNGYEIENLGYNGKYSNDKMNWTNNIIESITNKNPIYCYSDYKLKEVIDICSKNKMYTIKPTLSVNNYPFLTIKNNLSNGSIISFNINNELIKELPSIITYIKQKGYNIVTLENIISEKYDIEN